MKTSPVLGLLGGIGSGKTTVASILARNGAQVLDADKCANELLLDSEVRLEIKKAFGEGVFHADEKVDKVKLADRVFSNEAERTKINAIIHPRVRSLFREQIAKIRAQSPQKVIVLDIPLLLGSELRSLCDLLIMVRTSQKIRAERIKRFRGWDGEELSRREAFQPSLCEKEAAADIIIENEGSIQDLEIKVKIFLQNLVR